VKFVILTIKSYQYFKKQCFIIFSAGSVLLMEETGVSGENQWPAVSHWQIILYREHLTWAGFELVTTLLVIGTDCIGSYKSNYHMIMTTTVPNKLKHASYMTKTSTHRDYVNGE